MASSARRARIRHFFLLGLLAPCGACTMTQPPPAPAAEPPAPAFEAGVELPAGMGREILVAACLDCHALTALPLFKAFYTRDSWLTLVLTMKEHGADVDDAEIEVLADALKNGTYSTSRRTLLLAKVIRKGRDPVEFLALNEAVLARGQTGRLVSLTATVDGDFLNKYRADGLIVATPTGSTAYSLSAGGPLISPSADVFVITPVCPHTLSQRAVVIHDSAVVELSPDDPGDGPMLFTVDGRDCVELGREDRVEVRKADAHLELLRLDGWSFYGALRTKLNWRGG